MPDIRPIGEVSLYPTPQKRDAMTTDFRVLRQISQQLAFPAFANPEKIVAWMGAMQAQDYNMVKWAVGMRLKGEDGFSVVQKAFDEGKILRTHVMRPTWHIVPAEDIRWMCALSASSLQATIRDKKRMAALLLSEDTFRKGCRLFEQHLAGTTGMTKDELEAIFVAEGIPCVTGTMYRLLMFAETIGLICSGIDQNGKPTYALMDERVPPTPERSREESIALLAERYFRSHSPATLADFVWWSGLGIREARAGIEEIKGRLELLTLQNTTYYLHTKAAALISTPEAAVHLLPAFDEYTIAYKERAEVIHEAGRGHNQCSKNGFFYPLIADQGNAIGLWKAEKKRKALSVTTTFFAPHLEPNSLLLQAATERYLSFWSK